jgi:hypothetical protein
MKKIALSLFFASLFLCAGLGAAVPGEKNAQISLAMNVLMLSETHGGDSKAAFGPGLRVDFNLGRSFIIAPEVSAGIGGWSAGGTVNFRSKGFSAGAGYLVAGLGGSWGEWGANSLFKVQAGAKGLHWLFAASYVTNRGLNGVGLTAGYIF